MSDNPDRLPEWRLHPSYPVDAAIQNEQPLADVTGQSRRIVEEDGTVHVVEPRPNSPYNPNNPERVQ